LCICQVMCAVLGGSAPQTSLKREAFSQNGDILQAPGLDVLTLVVLPHLVSKGDKHGLSVICLGNWQLPLPANPVSIAVVQLVECHLQAGPYEGSVPSGQTTSMSLIGTAALDTRISVTRLV
jgi:hypothetical protein